MARGGVCRQRGGMVVSNTGGRLRWMALGCSVVALSSCFPASQAPRPADVVVRLPGGDCRAGDPCVLDFGAMEVGESVLRSVGVHNLGGTDDVLLGVQVSAGPVFRVEEGAAGALPAGGAGIPVALLARAAERGPVQAQLSIQTRTATIVVRLAAVGTLAGLEVTGDCAFGDVPVGTTSAPCDVSISNPGGGTARVDGVSIAGDVFTAQGVLVTPVVLQPGESITVRLVATPAVAGATTGWLSVQQENVILQGVTRLQVNGT